LIAIPSSPGPRNKHIAIWEEQGNMIAQPVLIGSVLRDVSFLGS